MDGLSDYLVDFAKERGLDYFQDEWKNVIMIKDSSPGYEEAEPVILQGHMDMVAVKKPGASIDMAKDGLRLAVDGDDLYAEDTSLGGALSQNRLGNRSIRPHFPIHGESHISPQNTETPFPALIHPIPPFSCSLFLFIIY